MTTQSYGDGRRMTIKEAVKRRARMIQFHGSLKDANDHANEPKDKLGIGQCQWCRWWSSQTCYYCEVFGNAKLAEDVAMADPDDDVGVVACCTLCREMELDPCR